MGVDKLYLFHNENLVGYFDVLGEYDLVFHKYSGNLDDASISLMNLTDNLRSRDRINSWLSTRIKPDEREDKLLWLTLTGIQARDNWGILVENYCVSYNDTFWWSKENDSSWFRKNHPLRDFVK